MNGRKRASAAALIGTLVLVGCCGAWKSNSAKYKKQMECATRVTDETSIKILKSGNFCCPALPKDIESVATAQRFYLLRAWGYNPSSPEPPMRIAQSYWEQQNYQQALLYFDAARARTQGAPIEAVIGEISMYRLLHQFKPGYAWIQWLEHQKGIDAVKVGDYLRARYLYDQGKENEAEPLFKAALKRAEKGDYMLAVQPYTMKDVWFYLAQIKLNAGDPQGAYKDFVTYLKLMSDPDFQMFYNYWMPRLGREQKEFYAKIEHDWVWMRQ